jgi:hypothetical protein
VVGLVAMVVMRACWDWMCFTVRLVLACGNQGNVVLLMYWQSPTSCAIVWCPFRAQPFINSQSRSLVRKNTGTRIHSGGQRFEYIPHFSTSIAAQGRVLVLSTHQFLGQNLIRARAMPRVGTKGTKLVVGNTHQCVAMLQSRTLMPTIIQLFVRRSPDEG